jgi:Holliday junction resolvase RusA-like endonuclease
MSEFNITLPSFKPPGGNQIRKMNQPYKYRALKDDWRRRFTRCFLVGGKTPVVTSFVEVRMTRFYTGRKMDMQNVTWMFKPALDVLQEMGVLIDDSPDHIREVYHQEKANENSILIQIKKADPEESESA